MAVDFNKLKICCLKPIDETHFKLNVYYTGYFNKTTKALVDDLSAFSPAQEADYQKAEFEISGDIQNVSLTTCTMAPNCAVTSTAKHITGFLNALNLEMINKKNKQLLLPTANYIDLFNSDSVYYEVPLRNLLNINAVNENGDHKTYILDIKPKWKASISSTTGRLDGQLTFIDKATNTSVFVDINIKQTEGATTTIDFTKVMYFTNLQPVTDISGCPDNRCSINKFTADAVTFDTANNKIYTRVEICVPNKTMTICEKAVLGNN